MAMRVVPVSLLLFLFIVLSNLTVAQVGILGPTCVRPGFEYQYIITGNWESESTSTVCVTGGIIADSGSSCISGNSFSVVRVTWSFDSDEGLIHLTSSEGNTSLALSITDTLRPGNVSQSVKKQVISADSIPRIIICAAARGGGCSPRYEYQWQQSTDDVNWENIAGSMSKDISFLTPLTKATYFRREVKETNSNSIEYSDVAAIFVDVEVE
jgi:hypothetical protein